MNQVKVIGVSGGSGAGKTYILDALKRRYLSVLVLPQDAYYHPTDGLTEKELLARNYDHPDAFDIELLASHLASLKTKQPIKMPQYCFEQHNRLKQTIDVIPNNNIFLEGMFAYHYPQLDQLFDAGFFINVPEDEWWSVM